jgi:hypothetical protein
LKLTEAVLLLIATQQKWRNIMQARGADVGFFGGSKGDIAARSNINYENYNKREFTVLDYRFCDRLFDFVGFLFFYLRGFKCEKLKNK